MNLQEFEEVLSGLQIALSRKSEEFGSVWIILYNNRRVKTNAGKIAWNTLGAAKLAFHNTFSSYYRIWDKKELLDLLIEKGIVEFKNIGVNNNEGE